VLRGKAAYKMLRMCFIFQVKEMQAKISMKKINGYYFTKVFIQLVRFKTKGALIEEFGGKHNFDFQSLDNDIELSILTIGLEQILTLNSFTFTKSGQMVIQICTINGWC
jgi:hypothetical protein